MKLISFVTAGATHVGVVKDEGIADITLRSFGRIASLRAALSESSLAAIRDLAARPGADTALSAVTLLPPLPDAHRYLCVGLNYRAHVAETGRDGGGGNPSVFIRTPSSVVAHGAPIIRPTVSDAFDFEGELAVVIGRGGRHIAPAQAFDHVAGYTIFNDGSIRDFQKHSVTAGKNFWRTGSCGPWIVTADAIADPAALTLATRLNGVEVQHSTTDMLIYDIPAIIAYLSTVTELEPGDIIATGTPEGVGMGRKPPLWMQPGDTLEVEITAIGTLRNTVVAEAGP